MARERAPAYMLSIEWLDLSTAALSGAFWDGHFSKSCNIWEFADPFSLFALRPEESNAVMTYAFLGSKRFNPSQSSCFPAS